MVDEEEEEEEDGLHHQEGDLDPVPATERGGKAAVVLVIAVDAVDQGTERGVKVVAEADRGNAREAGASLMTGASVAAAPRTGREVAVTASPEVDPRIGRRVPPKTGRRAHLGADPDQHLGQGPGRNHQDRIKKCNKNRRMVWRMTGPRLLTMTKEMIGIGTTVTVTRADLEVVVAVIVKTDTVNFLIFSGLCVSLVLIMQSVLITLKQQVSTSCPVTKYEVLHLSPSNY